MTNMTIKPDWELIGATLARCGSDEQVLFFRGFVKECNGWGTRLEVERQLAFVNGELTPDERETLSMIGYQEG